MAERPPLPRVFVASSREGQEVARYAQSELQRDAEVVIWDQTVFQPSRYTLETLVDELASYDFGLFVLTPDDAARMRHEEFRVARDNVILELGMFFGRLGRQCAMIIKPSGVDDFHLPTDLQGLTLLEYDPHWQNQQAAVGPACTKIRSVLARLGSITTSPNPASAPQANMPPVTPQATLRERRIHGAAVWIADLALETQIIRNREFEDCEINGPALVVIRDGSLVECGMEGDPRAAFLAIDPGNPVPDGAILLADCVLRRCRLRRITFLDTVDGVRILRQGFGLPPGDGPAPPQA